MTLTGKRKQMPKKEEDTSSGSESDDDQQQQTCLENPPISEILWNFLVVNYDHLQDSTKRQATNVCKIILKTLKSEKLPKPGENDGKYKEIYSKYLKLTQDSKLNIVDIFGRSLLEKQFDHLVSVVTKEYLFKDFSAEGVFELLKKELDDSTSIIFRPDFADLYSGVDKTKEEKIAKHIKKAGKTPANS